MPVRRSPTHGVSSNRMQELSYRPCSDFSAFRVTVSIPSIITSGRHRSGSLTGSTQEQLAVVGIVGTCNKNWYILSEITYWASRIGKIPDQDIRVVSGRLQNELSSLQQWWPSLDSQSSSVASAAGVTSWTAESYRLATDVYLLCRLCR